MRAVSPQSVQPARTGPPTLTRPPGRDHGGGWGWQLHVTGPVPARHRIGAQAGFGFADLVRLGETDLVPASDREEDFRRPG